MNSDIIYEEWKLVYSTTKDFKMKCVLTIGIGEVVKCTGYSTHETQYSRVFEYGNDVSAENDFVKEIQELHPFAELHIRHFV
jgi:hypothetical protein